MTGELLRLIERRWKAREYRAQSGPAISAFVFMTSAALSLATCAGSGSTRVLACLSQDTRPTPCSVATPESSIHRSSWKRLLDATPFSRESVNELRSEATWRSFRELRVATVKRNLASVGGLFVWNRRGTPKWEGFCLPRPAAHGHPHHGPGGRSRARRDGDLGPPDASDLRPVQHRLRARPRRRDS
jgi:hypothetical protein